MVDQDMLKSRANILKKTQLDQDELESRQSKLTAGRLAVDTHAEKISWLETSLAEVVAVY